MTSPLWSGYILHLHQFVTMRSNTNSFVFSAGFVLLCLIHQVVYHERHIQRFWERHRSLFPGAVLVGPEENLKEDKARTMAV